MDAFGKTIIAILLGWLLGLLSPPIVELIQRRHRRAELRRSLFIELEGLRTSLAALIYVIESNNRTVNRELLELLEPILRSDKAFATSRTTADEMSRLLNFTDEQIAGVMASQKAGGALSLKKINLPFLSSQLSSLYLFSPEFQRIALRICSRVTIINEEMDMAIFNYKKTFDSLPQQDHATVSQTFFRLTRTY